MIRFFLIIIVSGVSYGLLWAWASALGVSQWIIVPAIIVGIALSGRAAVKGFSTL